MTPNEKRFVAALLGLAKEEFSNHTCTDLPKNILNILSKEERQKLEYEFEKWNSNLEDYDPNNSITEDWLWMIIFARKLEEEANTIENYNKYLRITEDYLAYFPDIKSIRYINTDSVHGPNELIEIKFENYSVKIEASKNQFDNLCDIILEYSKYNI